MNSDSFNKQLLFQSVFSGFIAVLFLSLFLGYAAYSSDQSDSAALNQIQKYSEPELRAFIEGKMGNNPSSYFEAVFLVFMAGGLFILLVETLAYFLRRILLRLNYN